MTTPPEHTQAQTTLFRSLSMFLILMIILLGGAPAVPLVAAQEGASTSSTSTVTVSTEEPIVETATEPDVEREADEPVQLETDTLETTSPETTADEGPAMFVQEEAAAAAEGESLGPNLIVNPSWEERTSTGAPRGWFKGGYGANTRILTYPVPAYNGSNGGKVEVTNYTSGDAKWFFDEVPVIPGREYVFTDQYSASRESILTARYRMSDGSYLYPTLATLPSAASMTKATVRFTVPPNVVSLTIFHLIKGNGTLVTDEFELREVHDPGDPDNLVQNPEFESSGTGELPASWRKGGWGSNDRTFSYPVVGVAGSKAARVSMTTRTSGDAKWYTDPIPVSSGTYTYADAYSSNVTTYLTIEYHHNNGSLSYDDIGTLPPHSGFATGRANFFVPQGVTHVRVFHLLNTPGSLTIDNVSLTPGGAPKGVFQTGGVSLTFDDGWLNQLTYAVPKLESAGLKATFFITSRQMFDDGYPGFMSRAQVKELYDNGHEIGAHTQTHRALSSLNASEQETEIAGSRADLRALGIEPVNVFAYPFGAYDQVTLSLMAGAGLIASRSTLDGAANPTVDPYQLPRESLENDTTFAEVKGWIDSAMTNKEWLILTFHQIDGNGLRYTITPTLFNQIIDYIVANNVPVITVEDGTQALE